MKKRILSLCLALVLLGGMLPLGTLATGKKRGDVSDDDIVDYMDAMAALRHAVKLTTLTDEQVAIGDMDDNGYIDYMDAMMILRVAVKLAPEEEIEEPETEPDTVLGNITDRQILSEADARALILETGDLSGITGAEKALGECRTYSALGSVFYRFSQVYEGIPVFGRTVTVGASESGVQESLTHNYLAVSGLETTPKISREDAMATALREFPADAQVTGCQLAVYSLDGRAPTLAWQVEVSGTQLEETCFVDAASGEYIGGYSNLLYDTQRGSYWDSDGTVWFNTEKNADDSYSLMDTERNISVYDADGQTVSRTVADDAGVVYEWDDGKGSYVAPDGSPVTVDGDYPDHGTWDIKEADGTVVGKNADFYACVGEPLQVLKVLTNSTDIWTNEAAAKAMAYAAGTYDFYQEVLGRTGFNGIGGDMRVVVNDGMSGNTNNAYAAMGNTGAFAFLNFGSAMNIAPDVVGHEYNHAVEDSISDMIYAGESGSIMEGMADLFGELAEDWMNNGQMDNDCSWTNGARNMRDPSASSQQTCYYEYNGQQCPVKAKNADGLHLSGSQVSAPGLILPGVCYVHIAYPAQYLGNNYCYSENSSTLVHTNCTVISHAGYLMANGINGDELKKVPTGLLAKIWLRAMCMMSADCDFYECRKLVELAASSLNLTTQQQACVAEAFNAVGIHAEEEEQPEISFHLKENAKLNVYGGDGELYDNYSLSLARFDSLQAIQRLAGLVAYDKTLTVDSPEPVVLNVEPGIYLMRITDKGNTDLVYQRILLVSPLGEDSADYYTCFGGTAVRGTVSSVETINGRSRNVPLRDAKVFAYDNRTNKICGVAYLEDTGGVFTMYLPGGEYTLIARAEGYATKETVVTVRDGEKVYLAIVLDKEQSVPVGQLLSSLADGTEKDRYSMHYDENGQLSRLYYFAEEQAVVQDFSYDSQGRLILAEKHANKTTKKWYFYDENGLLITYQESTGSRRVPDLQIDYTYGEYGLCEMETHYVRSVNELVQEATISYSYLKDVDGRVVERHSFLSSQPDYVTVDRCEYDEMGRISVRRTAKLTLEQFRSSGNDHIEDSLWIVREYCYDYAPFVLIREDGVHLTLELRDSADVAVWSVMWENAEPEAAGALLTGLQKKDGEYSGQVTYLDGLTEEQEQRRLLRDELIWALKQHPIKTSHGRYSYYTFYTVYDIDGDGSEELIVNEDSGDYSIYTYDGEQAVRCGEEHWNYGDELYHYAGNGLVVHDGGMGILGLEYIYLYSLEKGKLKQQEVLASTEEITRKELNQELAKYERIQETIRVTDLSLLDALAEK